MADLGVPRTLDLHKHLKDPKGTTWDHRYLIGIWYPILIHFEPPPVLHEMQEIEALCEGWHPLFSKEDIVVLDGSDGCPDYRMRFDSTESCGTFFRNPAQDDFMASLTELS